MLIRTRLSVLVPVFFLIMGCIGGKTASIPTTYYTLEYQSPQRISQEPRNIVLRVDPITSVADPAGRDMIYRPGPFVRDAYHYHRWHLPPADLVQGLLLRDLRQGNLFRAVLSPEDAGAAQYRLNGQVEEFLQLEEQGKPLAVLAVSMTLGNVAGKDGGTRILLQKTYRMTEPLESRQPADLAKGMSAAMARFSQMLIGDIGLALNAESQR